MNHAVLQLKRELKTNLLDYLILFSAGLSFLVSLSIYRGERTIEFIILLAFASFYILWGIYHHIIEESLHLKTVIEYILISFTLVFLLKIIILP